MPLPARKTQLLLLAAMINAGCAQLDGSFVPAESASPLAWPNPTISTANAPLPPEPTLVPDAVMPVAKAAEAEMQRVNATQRRVAAASAATAARHNNNIVRVAQPVVPPPPVDLWQRVRAGYQMNSAPNPLTADWERFYASRPDYFAQMIDNSSHFLYHIVNEVERRGMPLEIALLPMIESAYNPVALSSAQASGIWQFIPSTGKTYGLRQNTWYDGRRDVIAATNAALDYLQMLHGMFNDWELALAAYNWGEGAVQRAIERNQARGLPTDYQSLYPNMPMETRNYVPKLLAVKNLISNPAQFGLTLAPIVNEPYFETVTLHRHIDITLAARFAGMTVEEFRFLNPANNKPVINSDSAETILLPRLRVAEFVANMAQNENRPLVSMKTHVVQAGELPNTIAEAYGITVAELNNLNGLGGRRRMFTGQTLIVPNRTDLQPVLADIPMPSTLIAAVSRPVYTRSAQVRRVVVIRGGVRRVAMVVAPVRRTVVRGRPVVVIRNNYVAQRPVAARRVAVNTVRPVARIRNKR